MEDQVARPAANTWTCSASAPEGEPFIGLDQDERVRVCYRRGPEIKTVDGDGAFAALFWLPLPISPIERPYV